MKRFDVVTIFPEIVEPYLNASILKRAQEKGLAKMAAHDLRTWTKDKHRAVDDAPYGGGAGMVMMLEPIFRAVKDLKKKSRGKTRVLLTSAAGKPFTQRRAEYYAKRYDQLVIICGRYEGVDHRVAQYVADEEVSVGPYVLTGGELPALTVIDAVTRLIPGVISAQSLAEESFSFSDSKLGPNASGLGPSPAGEYPQYTRPEVFYPEPKNKKKTWRVPKVLLEGNHKLIEDWRREHRR
jgi:tRNA (guanine37-N1)-methyltransferase